MLLLTACSGGSDASPPGGGATGTARATQDGVSALGSAIGVVSTLRGVVLSAAAAPGRTAAASDRADAAFATGVRADARAARNRVELDATETVVRGLRQQTANYAAALSRLAQVAASTDALSDVQREALEAVVSGGRTEAAAVNALQTQATSDLAVSRALESAQTTWLERRTRGWYRSTQEAADAYAVLTAPLRDRLAASRSGLATRDAALVRTSAQQDQAVAQADRALDSLR